MKWIRRWIYRAVEWLAETFGGLWFLFLYNVVTFAWVGFGLLDPHFFDPFPSNFYTLTVSWLAINMSTLILWAEQRSKSREDEQREKEATQTQLIVVQTETIAHMTESIQHIITHLVKVAEENGQDIDDIKDIIEGGEHKDGKGC